MSICACAFLKNKHIYVNHFYQNIFLLCEIFNCYSLRSYLIDAGERRLMDKYSIDRSQLNPDRGSTFYESEHRYFKILTYSFEVILIFKIKGLIPISFQMKQKDVTNYYYYYIYISSSNIGSQLQTKPITKFQNSSKNNSSRPLKP
jgi:hypothetical protein